MRKLDIELHAAAQEGEAARCHELIKRGAKVNSVNKEGLWSALHWAAWQGSVDTCQILLKHGANIHAVDGDGWSALHQGAWDGCAPVCLLLLEHEADLLLNNKVGKTALDLAIERKKESCASAIQTWVAARVARAALQEITAAGALKAATP